MSYDLGGLNLIAGAGGGGAPYQGPGTVTVPPPPPTATPPPTVNTSPAYNPDYGSLIQNDPAYQTAQQVAQRAQADAGASRQAALRQALIRYGGIPSGFSDPYGDIDQATRDAASQNQQSTLANLRTNYGTSQSQLRRALAARGALQSGDLNYGEDQLDKGYAQQQYDAANSFGDAAASTLNAYTGVLNANAQNLASGIQAAESNVLGQVDSSGNPIYAPRPAQTAAYDSGYSSAYHRPIYKGSDGQYYNADGSPFTPYQITAFG